MNTAIIIAVTFIGGTLIGPLLKTVFNKIGQKIKSDEKKIIDAIQNEMVKEAVINFMKELNIVIASEDGKKKMELAIAFTTKLITKAIPGSIDDAIIPSIIGPILQGLYEGYIKEK